jgi:hypothetical protein
MERWFNQCQGRNFIPTTRRTRPDDAADTPDTPTESVVDGVILGSGDDLRVVERGDPGWEEAERLVREVLDEYQG